MSTEIARQAKAEKSLNKLIRYKGSVMSKKEWIETIFKDGYLPIESTKNRIQFKRSVFNRMNHSEQEDYEKKCSEIVPCFEAKKGKEYYEISKTEFEYMNTL